MYVLYTVKMRVDLYTIHIISVQLLPQNIACRFVYHKVLANMDRISDEEEKRRPLLVKELQSVSLDQSTSSKATQEVSGNEDSRSPYLKYPEHQFMRTCLIGLALGLFFTLGAGYYSFPMWLNIILAKHVDLSRGDMSLLGGTTYVSLGVCGIFVMWLTSQNFFKVRIHEFKVLSSVGALFVISAYGFLNYLVSSSQDAPGHNVVAVGFTMAVYGFGVGTFYMVWFTPVLAIIDDKWKFLYIALSNVMFSAGATVSLSMKFFLQDAYWMAMMLGAQCLMLLVVISFVFYFHKILFVPEPVPTASEGVQLKSHVVETREFIWKLATFRRNLTPEEVIHEKCDLTSRQFYLIFGAFVLVNATSTTFMANLGPLTSNDSDTDGSDRDQLVVLVLSTVGQCIGRSLVPVITYFINRRYDEIQSTKQSGPLAQAMRMSRLLTRTTLLFTLAIGMIFTIGLLFVKFADGVPFEVESTVISVGYGAMWCVTSSYPAFLHNQDQSFVLSFQQVLGALSTLICVLLVAALQFGNTETFTFLLVLSIATVFASAFAFYDRIRAEPSRALIRLHEPASDTEAGDEEERGDTDRGSVSVRITESPVPDDGPYLDRYQEFARLLDESE